MRKFKVKVKQGIRSLLNRFNYDISKLGSVNYFEFLLNHKLSKTENFFFVQIGANDGIMADPIYDFVTHNHKKLQGIAIEPMKDVYKKLQLNYKKYPNIKTANFAIHRSEKEMTIYRVDPARAKQLGDWTSGIASFDKNHYERSNIPKEYIISEIVECMTFQEFLKKYSVKKIDLLQIDTEGYDSEIILSIDFNEIKPSIIRFEHGLSAGTMNKDTFLAVVDTLHDNGYEIAIEKFDATAYLLKEFVP